MKSVLEPALGILALCAAAAACNSSSEGLRADPIPSPAGEGARLSSVASAPDGRLLLSWVEPGGEEGSDALLLSEWRGSGGWGPVRTVAEGAGWFVNWADFPSVAADGRGGVAAHWLERLGEGRYAYGVRVIRSSDGGASWSAPVWLHEDRSPTEHGFVALVAGEGSFEAVWLDGRATLGGEGGAMTLRWARLPRQGPAAEERLLDGRVCDCCQTAGVRTESGILVAAYRDRSEEEVRDVSVVRRVDGVWSDPRPLHRDGWVFPGCPVNGPALAASGERVGAVWYTEGSDGAPRVKVAVSADGGGGFGEPRVVDGGRPLGRVDVAAAFGGMVVSWLEEAGEGEAAVMARRVPWAGDPGPPLRVATTASSRASGFPRLAASGDRVLLTYTRPGPPSKIETVLLAPGPAESEEDAS